MSEEIATRLSHLQNDQRLQLAHYWLLQWLEDDPNDYMGAISEARSILSRAGGAGSGEPQVSSGRLEQPVEDAGQSVNASRTADAEEKPSTPSGWKLVPVEPTKRMVKRGRAEIGGGSTFSQEEREEMASEIYLAMLAASPSPPPPAGEDMSVEPSQQFADPGKMVGSHASYTTPPPAAGWTEEQIKSATREAFNALNDFNVLMGRLTMFQVERAMRAALSTLAPPPSGWLPIESAPRDGTEFLCYWKPLEGKPEIVRARYNSDPPWIGFYGLNVSGMNGCGSISHLEGGFPETRLLATHWQPLPPPPSGRE